MPRVLHVSDSLLVVSCYGVIRGPELIEYQTKLLEDSRLGKVHRYVYDMKRVMAWDVSPVEWHTIARLDWKLSFLERISKIAIVGDAEILRLILGPYDLYSRMWVGRPNDYTVKAFYRLVDALRWIQTDKDSHTAIQILDY